MLERVKFEYLLKTNRLSHLKMVNDIELKSYILTHIDSLLSEYELTHINCYVDLFLEYITKPSMSFSAVASNSGWSYNKVVTACDECMKYLDTTGYIRLYGYGDITVDEMTLSRKAKSVLKELAINHVRDIKSTLEDFNVSSFEELNIKGLGPTLSSELDFYFRPLLGGK